MISVIILIVAIILAYLIGSFPTSFILTKFLKGIDIRQVGSGNAGATNVLRAAGKLPALVTLIVDVLKGVFVVTIFSAFFYSFEENLLYEFYRPMMGLVVVCGHIWPIFLNFRGGKGVATTLGVGIGLTPIVLLPSAIIWAAVFFMSNYVSLASIIALASFPVFAAIFNKPIYLVFFSSVICLISIFKHKDNIKRLLRGEEHKVKL